ncbi:MAG: hypothetical protein LBF41_07410 [Deltaproteobacteria bacterium]|jgi:regulator of replication initiation timing|nr:hypothetical protein [Deltaproteobacteria bacterium]
MKKRIFFALAVPLLLLASSCDFDSKEQEDLKLLREEYLTQIAELRQSIETMNRNITVTYQELETLRARLEEEERIHASNASKNGPG